MVYQGRVVNGVIVLDGAVQLPDGTTVQVVLAESPEGIGAARSAAKSIEREIAEIVAGVPAADWARLPADLSEQLDHYIYGTPKQSPYES